MYLLQIMALVKEVPRVAAPITASAKDVGEVARVIELRHRGGHNLTRCGVQQDRQSPGSNRSRTVSSIVRLEKCAADDAEVKTCQL